MALLHTTSQIITAGVAIIAFSLLLYALTFNLRERVVRLFALILVCVVIVFTAEAIGGTLSQAWEIEFWLRFQWVGIVGLPPAYIHFSDSILATTGRPSRGRRTILVVASYVISAFFLVMIPSDIMFGDLVMNRPPAAHLQRTFFTDLFTFYYLLIIGIAWINFVRAYQRTIMSASRRRMIYLIVGSIAPAIGCFPFLLFGSGIASNYPIAFWAVVAISNFFVGALIIIMAYSVSFFGVTWPDRVIRSRLFKWIMRGPVTAIFTLGVVTVTRRFGLLTGNGYIALVPILMVVSILLSEFVITLFNSYWERSLFFGKDGVELTRIKNLANRFLTENDLRQFLELILAAACDLLRAKGAFIVTLNKSNSDIYIHVGDFRFEDLPDFDAFRMSQKEQPKIGLFQWGTAVVTLLQDENNPETVYGILGVIDHNVDGLPEEEVIAIQTLAGQAMYAIREWFEQKQAIESLEMIGSQVDYIHRLSAAARYDESMILEEVSIEPDDLAQLVKEALAHYWGGPKLTNSPLMQLQVVQETLNEHEGNTTNALRAILRQAIESTRPDGERKFTSDWILYNILELRFLEGKKVREIALRLAVSEADLYRKQRIAIEEVKQAIIEMELNARHS
ncbi:MAG: hypothetical protein HPY76_12285 [Anaerolineae bacterium]|nr:hypothetical protein [Anaerolineae bacterium]